MTLYQIISTLKGIALTQPNVKSATDGSVYEVMNTNPSVKYDVVHFSQTSHQSDEEWDYYGFNIFYISRLEDSLEDNRLQIQSIGKEVLDNIIRTLCENWNIPFPTITYVPFTQKFADLTAGVYCTIRLEVPKELICADDYIAEIVPGSGIKLQDLTVTITENGLRVFTPGAEYDGIGEIRIVTDVPQVAATLQDKEVEYTENGSYRVQPDPAYDGLSSVSVDVLVEDHYDEGYDDGKQDGENEQKAKLTVTSFTENNTYTRENGWSAVTVDVPQTGQTINNQQKSVILSNSDDFSLLYNTRLGTWIYYLQEDPMTITPDSGYTGLDPVYFRLLLPATAAIEKGAEGQKAKLSSTSFTQNDTYSAENGWSSVTVDVDDRYDEGFEDGEEEQKSKLTTLYVDVNGTYTRPDGYYSITVDVPQSGYSQQDLEDAYNRGYQDGLEACQQLPVTATSITINVANTITDSGSATTTVNPSGATTNLTYTSSDTTKATIGSTSGIITVKKTGTVQFCVRDSISNLQSCKTVNVVKTQTITAFTYTADTSLVAYSGENRTITYSTSGFNSSSIGLVASMGLSYTKSGNTYALTFPYNYYGEQKTYYAKLTGYTSNGTYIETRIDYTQEAYPTNGKFRITYYVTSTTVPTQLFYDSSGCHPNCVEDTLDSAKIVSSNTNIPLTSATYTFPSTGNVVVEYTLKGGVLGHSTFFGCSKVVAAKIYSVKVINYSVFKNCSNLSSVTMWNDTVKLGNSIFQNCSSLSTIAIGTGVSELPEDTFNGCSSLATITIPNNITSIDSFCFEGCSGLTSMTFQATTTQTVPYIDNTSLGSTSYTYPFYVPSGMVSTYKTKWAQSGYENRVQERP